ncbi:phage head closure protein [Paenibacillus pinihumi]|uniref:phage head closure protein n=1 Tax=Paenibacillus pinihumi TaxID=669462 RepID=UPI00048F3019|nr:phage head closure protein [Paenibacillus pinihumi]
MNKRIEILNPGESRNKYNEPIKTLELVARPWAAVEPLQGREYYAAAREHADVTTKITIRYRKDVDRTMFVQCDGVMFEILHIIDPEFKHEELHLMCKERQ